MLTSMRRSSTCMVENVVKPVGAEIHRRAGAIPISPGPSVSWPPSTATRRRWASPCTGCWRPRGARRWPRCAARPTRPATRQPTTASPRPDRSAMPVSSTPCALSRGSSNPMASDTCPALGAGQHARIRRAVKARGHFPNEQALKCVYMAIMSLDPTGTGQRRRSMLWKPALNVFDMAFDGRLSAGRR